MLHIRNYLCFREICKYYFRMARQIAFTAKMYATLVHNTYVEGHSGIQYRRFNNPNTMDD